MSTKMKGLFKGIRYISSIFDEEQKEQDFQIGLPTDVKHVAHVGWDGPGLANSTSADSPNWTKDAGSTGKDNGEVKWVSEDSKRAQRTKKEKDQQGEGSSKPSRRHSSDNKNAAGESKPRQSRRNHAKDPSDAAAGQDTDAALKKTRRKKSEAGDQAGPRRPKNRSAANSVDASGVDGGVKLNSDDEEREDSGRAAQLKGSLQS